MPKNIKTSCKTQKKAHLLVGDNHRRGAAAETKEIMYWCNKTQKQTVEPIKKGRTCLPVSTTGVAQHGARN